MFPGQSAHLELSELVAAGLTPYQALAPGTRNLGHLLHRLARENQQFGTVTVSRCYARAACALRRAPDLYSLGQAKMKMRAPPNDRALPAAERPRASRMLSSVLAAWVLSLGFDMFLHGGLLARLYVEPSPFLLAPEEAFRRIPLGYLTFLILTLSLYWLFRQLDVRGARAGLRYGAAAGVVVWGALVLGLYSISTAGLPLLIGWWLGQSLELGLAGAVLGAAAGGTPSRRIWGVVMMVVVACIAVTIALQSLGWAPPMRVVRQAYSAA